MFSETFVACHPPRLAVHSAMGTFMVTVTVMVTVKAMVTVTTMLASMFAGLVGHDAMFSKLLSAYRLSSVARRR